MTNVVHLRPIHFNPYRSPSFFSLHLRKSLAIFHIGHEVPTRRAGNGPDQGKPRPLEEKRRHCRQWDFALEAHASPPPPRPLFVVYPASYKTPGSQVFRSAPRLHGPPSLFTFATQPTLYVFRFYLPQCTSARVRSQFRSNRRSLIGVSHAIIYLPKGVYIIRPM